MTERFSPEYIELVSNSKHIQALWEPKVGDWVDARGFGRQPAIGVIYAQNDLGEGHWSVAFPGLDTRRTNIDITWLRWLPTLEDLVEGLEKMGIGWGAYKRHPSDGTGYRWYAQDDYAERYTILQPATSPILAAARMLERVLEESDEQL